MVWQLDTGCLGAMTFLGKGSDGAGPNGLPLSPLSVQMLGRFQALRAVFHSHLCRYVDLCRTPNDRIVVISEHHKLSVCDLLKEGSLDNNDLMDICFQLSDALGFLHGNGIVVGFWQLSNILVSHQKPICIRLAQYGIDLMSKEGVDVAFRTENTWYLCPERLSESVPTRKISPKSDIWSLGIVLLEIASGLMLRKIWRLKQITGVLTSVIQKNKTRSAIDRLIQAMKFAMPEKSWTLSDSLRNIIEQCLTILPSKRPTAKEISGQLSRRKYYACTDNLKLIFHSFTKLRCIPEMNTVVLIEEKGAHWMTNSKDGRPIAEVYYLWKLSGSDVETILTKMGVLRVNPPVRTIPRVVIDECDIFGNEENRMTLTHFRVMPLSLKNVRKRLKVLPLETFAYSTEFDYRDKEANQSSSEREIQPVVVKERDIEYQLNRMVMFDKLISSYPYKAELMIKECKRDIVPVYRGYVWAVLLNVRGDVGSLYAKIDTESVTVADRQIEVDIPRCHQYDELLSSPKAHSKLKRVLKAWIVMHPHYVYWQGLDSLSAPFIYLHFNDEALAYACVKAFVQRYLFNFFLKDNSAVIQEYLAVFNHLLAFLDAELYTHLRNIDFMPELYAIPWFLTMFAHVLPLHKLFHFWDTLLLSDDSFPLFFGVAILSDLRQLLLKMGFNECILLFSDLPDIDVEKCVNEAKTYYATVPKSCTYRQHGSPIFTEGTENISMTRLEVKELHKYSCPRLSPVHLMSLVNGSKQNGRFQSVLAIDVRPAEEFNRGAIASSLNIPFGSLDSLELAGSATKAKLSDALMRANNGMVICVIVGSLLSHAKTFARELVEANYNGVCILDRGVDVLKCTNWLTVPTDFIP